MEEHLVLRERLKLATKPLKDDIGSDEFGDVDEKITHYQHYRGGSSGQLKTGSYIACRDKDGRYVSGVSANDAGDVTIMANKRIHIGTSMDNITFDGGIYAVNPNMNIPMSFNALNSPNNEGSFVKLSLGKFVSDLKELPQALYDSLITSLKDTVQNIKSMATGE